MEQLKKLPELLLPWYRVHKRDLPWRQDTDPYHVWLSEIMLQQTRVEAVKGYYSRFLAALPDVESLANAPQEQCHKLWEGLGYYSRVRNLQKAAKQIMEHHNGRFPHAYDEILSLAGIGEYTAGAVASICFSQPTPAVDGNVIRVITRLLTDPRPVNDPKLKKEITAMLREVYPKDACGDFTQALMELGATVCLPNGQPHCETCPIAPICHAKSTETALYYPVKAVKKPRKIHKKTVFILRCGDKYAIMKRPETGLLAGLWEYPNVAGALTLEDALAWAEAHGAHPTSPDKTVEKVHVFTHIEWKMQGIYLNCSSMPDGFTWATKEELAEKYALPTAFRQFQE